MKLKTKRAIEVPNTYIEIFKEFERQFKVEIVIQEAKRVDREEVERTKEEIERTLIFKDAKIDVQTAVRARFMYYRAVLKLPYADTINMLANNDFLKGANTIKQYLMGCTCLKAEFLTDVSKKLPIFDWSCVPPRHRVRQYSTRAERARDREMLISSYYYFYTYCVGYIDVDRDYLLCYRDFHITPNQLRRIIAEHKEYIEDLRMSEVAPVELRRMFPAFAWDHRNPYENLEYIETVRDSLDVYKVAKKRW